MLIIRNLFDYHKNPIMRAGRWSMDGAPLYTVSSLDAKTIMANSSKQDKDLLASTSTVHLPAAAYSKYPTIRVHSILILVLTLLVMPAAASCTVKCGKDN